MSTWNARALGLSVAALAAWACSGNGSAGANSPDSGAPAPTSTASGGSDASTTPATQDAGAGHDAAGADSAAAAETSTAADAGESDATTTDASSARADASASAKDATTDAAPDVGTVSAAADATATGFDCTLIIGLGSTADWIYGGNFFGLVDGTKWESLTKHEEHVQDFANPNDSVWTQGFDSPDGGSMRHTCAQHSTSPDRVVFVAFAATTDSTYNDYTNVSDPTVLANWVSILNQDVATIQQKFPSVKQLQLMTFIRGPGTSGPGMDCMPAATTDHEDIVMPWVDNAIATVAQSHSPLVTVAPSYYIGDCSWFDEVGPHFLPNGKPALVAAEIAPYYLAHP